MDFKVLRTLKSMLLAAFNDTSKPFLQDANNHAPSNQTPTGNDTNGCYSNDDGNYSRGNSNHCCNKRKQMKELL